VARAGFGVILWDGWVKTLLFIVIAPTLGMFLGLTLTIATLWLFRNAASRRVDRTFRKLQLVSAALYSLGHGTNDAQKTMGIIAGVLFTARLIDHFYIPFWVILICHAAIALGTLSGGWRIVKTMGMKITELRPVGGFCAETSGAVTIIGSALLGIPVSTTHTITGAIVGVGATRRLSAVRWGVARRIVWAWLLTIPCSALMGALILWALSPFL
jgi:PiT family inorganic phosphate transporter